MLYHTKLPGPSVNEFQTAFAKSIGTAIENDTNEVLIYVHGKTNLDGIISAAIGGMASKLQKSGFVTLGDVKVYLETEKKQSSFCSGTILASHISTKLLNKILSDSRATDIIYVPWASEELESYLQNNESTEI